MHYIPHTFFIVTINMLLTNVSNMYSSVFIAVCVIIHKLGSTFLVEHFSTVRVCTVGESSTGPGIFIRCNLNTVIAAYPCPFPTDFFQANKVFNSRVPSRLKFLHQKIQFVLILDRNKLTIVQQAQIQALIPSCYPLSTGRFMNCVTRTTGFKCLTFSLRKMK